MAMPHRPSRALLGRRKAENGIMAVSPMQRLLLTTKVVADLQKKSFVAELRAQQVVLAPVMAGAGLH